MRFLLAGAGFAAFLTGAAAAQMPPPPPGAMAPPTRAQVEATVATQFAAMDADHDGTVTRSEFEGFRAARNVEMEARMKARRDRDFARRDADRNGSRPARGVDAPSPPSGGAPLGYDAAPPPGAEMPPPPGDMRGPYRPIGPGMGMAMRGPRWFDRADANGDGKVTPVEAKATALAMFDRVDTDHDGTIGPDEMKAIRDMRGPGRGGPDGPGGDMPPPPPQG